MGECRADGPRTVGGAREDVVDLEGRGDAMGGGARQTGILAEAGQRLVAPGNGTHDGNGSVEDLDPGVFAILSHSMDTIISHSGTKEELRWLINP
ncbi:hypothetical protein GCM10009631_12990 [Corynebacterium glaucum]